MEQLQRQSLTKEEEQQVLFLQKETKHITEQQRLQSELSDAQAQLQTRERQVKKLQEKNDAWMQTVKELEEAKEQLSKELQHLKDDEVRSGAVLESMKLQVDKANEETQAKIE